MTPPHACKRKIYWIKKEKHPFKSKNTSDCKSFKDAGKSLDRVVTLKDHKNLNTTAKYTRATRKDLQRAVEKLTWE